MDQLFYKTQIDFHDISIVNTAEDFLNCLSSVREALNTSEKYQLTVGLSVEESEPQGDKPCLLTLALAEKAFVLDLHTLAQESTNYWQKFIDKIMSNGRIIKLVFSSHAVWHRLSFVCEELRDLGSDVARLYDMKKMFHVFGIHDRKMFSYNRKMLPFPSHKSRRRDLNVSTCVEMCFGQEIQSETFPSHLLTEAPLSLDQLMYTVTKAWSLIQLYEEFEHIAQRDNFNFNYYV